MVEEIEAFNFVAGGILCSPLMALIDSTTFWISAISSRAAFSILDMSGFGKSAIDIGKIAKNVGEINDKLDLLLGKRSAKIELKEEKTEDKKIKKEKKKK